MQRVIAYIDGFNLYFGLKSKGWKRYYWLNVQLLAHNLLRPQQQLVATKYFTARIANPEDKRLRQAVFLDALQTLTDFQIFLGQYQINPQDCPRCGRTYQVHNEKMTDVHIAVQLLTDAFQNRFDMALLVSADSDLLPPIQAVRHLFPHKSVVLAFPPARFSRALTQVANAYFTIGRVKLARSLFPPEVVRSDGYVLRQPQSWR